jgi:hypothetical protein
MIFNFFFKRKEKKPKVVWFLKYKTTRNWRLLKKYENRETLEQWFFWDKIFVASFAPKKIRKKLGKICSSSSANLTNFAKKEKNGKNLEFFFHLVVQI